MTTSSVESDASTAGGLPADPHGSGVAPTRRHGGLLVLVVIGVGLIAAPAVFQMFSRAPKGGEMIDQFRPYMTRSEVATLRGFMAEIDAALAEAQQRVDPAAAERLGLDAAAYRQHVQYLAALEQQWPSIEADMIDMLDRMDTNLDNFAAVDALPSFRLFPWFFVVPGVLVAVVALGAWRARRAGRQARGALIALVVIGVGLVAAPAVFQMFSRAPKGGEMINDFRPLMTRHKVTTTQGYFVTIGNGEAELRSTAVPASGIDPASVPAVTSFAEHWPRINAEMAPVVGVMSDNVDNFAAIDALPPFPLFPWFFVAPGVLVVALAGLALRNRVDPESVPRP